MDICFFDSSYNNIYGCRPFLAEKQALYRKNPSASKQYDKWLDRQLRFLDTEGLDVIRSHPRVFEKLQDTSVDLYCIRRKEFTGNPRIIFFAVIENGEEPAFVLLTAFHEYNDGDYVRAIDTATQRQKSIMRQLTEEET